MANFSRVSAIAALLGVAGTVVCAVAWQLNSRTFFPGYLTAWLFWLGISLGCLVLLMIHSVTGGGWGETASTGFACGVAPLVLLAVLFVPVWFGLDQIYPWAQGDRMSTDEALCAKSEYLTEHGLAIRSAIYFVLWILLGVGMTRPQTGNGIVEAGTNRPRRAAIGGPGLMVYGLSASLASVNWAMSLEPLWYSTMYGTIFMASQAASGLAFAILFAALMVEERSPRDDTLAGRLQDLGNLLLTAIIFWAYVVFMQFLLMWSGNLPEEVSYYVIRSRDGWQFIVTLMACLFFIVPLAALLSRELKRNRRQLAAVAGSVLVATLFNWYLLVVPPFGPAGTSAWQTIAALIAIGGFWMTIVARQVANRGSLVAGGISRERSGGRWMPE